MAVCAAAAAAAADAPRRCSTIQFTTEILRQGRMRAVLGVARDPCMFPPRVLRAGTPTHGPDAHAAASPRCTLATIRSAERTGLIAAHAHPCCTAVASSSSQQTGAALMLTRPAAKLRRSGKETAQVFSLRFRRARVCQALNALANTTHNRHSTLSKATGARAGQANDYRQDMT